MVHAPDHGFSLYFALRSRNASLGSFLLSSLVLPCGPCSDAYLARGNARHEKGTRYKKMVKTKIDRLRFAERLTKKTQSEKLKLRREAPKDAEVVAEFGSGLPASRKPISWWRISPRFSAGTGPTFGIQKTSGSLKS